MSKQTCNQDIKMIEISFRFLFVWVRSDAMVQAEASSSRYHLEMSSDLFKQIAALTAGREEIAATLNNASRLVAQPREHDLNPAAWTHKRLGKYITEFEAKLDPDHEIGARLVCFGHTVQFHIEHVGYHGPDIISFDGVNDTGEPVQLIQNIAQLSVLLVAMKKTGTSARRIGFIWADEPAK